VVVAGAWVVVVVAGAWVVVVVAGAWVVVVVAGAWVVVVVAGGLGCLLILVVVVTSCRDRTLGEVAPGAPRTTEDFTVALAPLLIARELTVAPELLLTAREFTSAASPIATTIPPARVRRR
jgi:hypothetical protein